MNYHKPVMLKECIEALNIKEDGVYVDLTFGGGGHSKEIIKHIGQSGKLIGFDQDEEAKENRIIDDRFIFVQHNFKHISNFLKYHGFDKVDGILADLGISSHHIDEASRGFSFRFDAPLDMRMNRQSPFSAKELVSNYSEAEISRVLWEYGEIRNSKNIASAIVKARLTNQINTVFQLIEVLKPFTPKQMEHKSLAPIFQALRIEVNQELESLKEMLLQSTNLLNTGGRIVIMTYHSLEDRLVKNFFKSGNFEGNIEKDFYGNVLSPFKIISKGVITPSKEELDENNRSRSAKLRIVEKK